MRDADAADLPIPDRVYRSYRRTCRRLKIKPVARERDGCDPGVSGRARRARSVKWQRPRSLILLPPGFGQKFQQHIEELERSRREVAARE